MAALAAPVYGHGQPVRQNAHLSHTQVHGGVGLGWALEREREIPFAAVWRRCLEVYCHDP